MSVWRRNKSSKPQPLHQEMGERNSFFMSSLQASAPADRAQRCLFALPATKIQPREVFSSLHLPCQQELFAQIQGQSSGTDVGAAEGAPKVGGCFRKSENVEHMVWGHWSMNTDPFTAFAAEGSILISSLSWEFLRWGNPAPLRSPFPGSPFFRS